MAKPQRTPRRPAPTAVLRRLRALYGASPLHLLALLGCFALAGWVVLRLSSEPLALRMLIWFLAAVIGHDLVLFPLYAIADRSLHGLLHRLPLALRARPLPLSPHNYLRTPILGSALLLVLFLPGIIQQGAGTYLAATGLTQAPFLGRWLLLTAAMFGSSALVYAIRLGQLRREHSPAKRGCAKQEKGASS